jgi:hypothetical protein
LNYHLPPPHTDANPIYFIWAQVADRVGPFGHVAHAWIEARTGWTWDEIEAATPEGVTNERDL